MDLVTLIKDRKSADGFGYGITTADRYVRRAIEECGSGLVCDAFGAGEKSLLNEAAVRLSYSNDRMVKQASSVGSFDTLLPSGVAAPEHTLMVFQHVVTTSDEDRDKDILRTDGMKMDPRAPLLWQHVHTMPIGKFLAEVEHTKDVLRAATCLLDLNELTSDVAKLIEADVLRFSHGFTALEFNQRKEEEGETTGAGFEIKRGEILEISLVSVPANISAEVELFAKGQLESELFKAHAKHYHDARTKQAPGASLEKQSTQLTLKLGDAEMTVETVSPVKSDQMIAKKVMSAIDDVELNGQGVGSRPKTKHIEGRVPETKHFDLAKEQLEASTLEYEWASRFLACQIKDLMVTSTFVPKTRQGSWFTGERLLQSSWEMHDQRRITHGGKEMPPLHESIQLNSKSSDTFLTDGIQFWLCDGYKLCVKHQQGYAGAHVTIYAAAEQGVDYIDKCWAWAIENNFMKGEAFNLSGEFLSRTGEGWEDVILETKNITPIKSWVRLINEKGKRMPNRGAAMIGPPGCGKTLSGRIMMNTTKATFIWINARDASSYGMIGAFCSGMDLAKELAPSILMIEDIDNYMSDHAVDVIKSEMDGISRSSGVLTVLTTNHPENWPAALVDRPGRFHDILEFHLPTEAARVQMIEKFSSRLLLNADGTKAVSASLASKIAKDTEGYSGAHMYELVYFTSLIRDEDECEIKDAFDKALKKIDQQRELLGQHQTSSGMYRKSVKSYPMRKAGRTLSRANIDLLQDVSDDIEEVMAKENMSRGSKAMLERCHNRLKNMLEGYQDDDETAEKPKTAPVVANLVEMNVQDAMRLVLTEASSPEQRKLWEALGAMLVIEAQEERAASYRELVGCG